MNQTDTTEQEVLPESELKFGGGVVGVPGGSLPSLWLLPRSQEKLQDRHVDLTDLSPY